jgi:hypothetical protein
MCLISFSSVPATGVFFVLTSLSTLPANMSARSLSITGD